MRCSATWQTNGEDFQPNGILRIRYITPPPPPCAPNRLERKAKRP